MSEPIGANARAAAVIRALAHRFFEWLGPRTVNVHIEQHINTYGDPDRLRIATRRALDEALKSPLSTFRRHVLDEDPPPPEPPPTPPPVES